MMISQQQQASRRRRQRSYMPRILEDDTHHTHQHTGARNNQKGAGALALALQSRKPSETIKYSNTSESSRTSTANTSYFLQETTETFQETLSAIRKDMQEYNCLRKAFLLYLLCVQLNFIPKTSIRTQVFLNFLRYYPTMVGWIFLATKCNRFLSSPKTTKLSSDKATGGSSDTVDTVSSCMSQDASIDDHDQNQDLSRCHTNTSDTSNTALDDDTVTTKVRIDLNNEDIHTQTKTQDLQAQPSKSSSWGFFVTAKSNSAQEILNNDMDYDDDDDDEYSYNMPSMEQTASFEVYPNHTPNNDAEETIINDETRHRRPQQAVDSDWGYFADFPEEAPSPQVEKKKSKFQRSRYYSIYKKYTSMYS